MRLPSPFSQPPIWREGRLGLEVASLLRDPVFRGEGVRDAGGQPAFLIPGFLAGDDSLGVMTRWLRRTGHHTHKAGMRSNVSCSEEAVNRLEERVELLAERREQKVAIIGQSRGGNFARGLAGRGPGPRSGGGGAGPPPPRPPARPPPRRAPGPPCGARRPPGGPRP